MSRRLSKVEAHLAAAVDLFSTHRGHDDLEEVDRYLTKLICQRSKLHRNAIKSLGTQVLTEAKEGAIEVAAQAVLSPENIA